MAELFTRFLILSNLHFVTLGLLSLVLPYVIFSAIYNIYFHPLSKFPGPKLAAANGLTYWAVSWSGNLVYWLRDLHAKYGEVVRYGPNKLSYISPGAWKDIYGHRIGGRKANPKDTRFYPAELNGHRSLVNEKDDMQHGRIRRIFAYAFSDRALKEQESLIKRYADQLMDNIHRFIEEDANIELDLLKLYNCTTFDIMGDLAFGEPLGLLEHSEYSPWVQGIFGGIKAGDMLRITVEYPILGKIAEHFVPRQLKAKQKEHFQFSTDRVNRRLEKGSNKPDFWTLILRQPEGSRLSIEDMHANSSLFMIGGTETTATLLSGLTFYLLQNADKLQKLVEEVRTSFTSEDQLTIENLQKLKYMWACFEEALRMYPPAPSGLPREVAEGGNVICGRWVPETASVSVTQYAAFRSPLNFKDPDSFIPERWFPDTGFDDDRKEVFQPFSFGPRNCLGKKSLAYHEMRLLFSKTLWHFDLELCPQSESWTNQKAYTIWEKHPLMVKFKPAR
ncbi:Cytochrome P450 [Neofusicoccum parvum]|uniref:Cytochrome P450 n=1 Tax=Neofusicoccum parvum TaxID=310453 RepID=A0ACB5S967_9PEZI|nr:Cytochrome P450 [Neofusicoccum parvum]